MTICLLTCISLGACTSEQRTGDGQLAWRFDKIWSVGGAADLKVSLGQIEAYQVATDRSDVIYVLDRLSHRIFVLNRLGEVTDTFGRKGSGPGEFIDPWSIAVDAQGGVNVLDLATRRVIRWDAHRALLPPVPIQEMIEHPKFAFQNDEVIFSIVDHSGDGPREYRLAAVGPGGSRVLARLERPPLHLGDLPTCGATSISLVPIFMPALHWDATGDQVVVSAGPEYRIQRYRAGHDAGVIERNIAPERADQSRAEAEAVNWRFNDCLVPPAEVVRASGFRAVIPVIRALALGPDGELWVERRINGVSGSAVDTFDSTGTFQGTLPDGAPFPAAFLRPDRVVAVEQDADGVPRVTLYNVVRR